MTHTQLRYRLYKAVPYDGEWHARREAYGSHIDPSAKWRADVLVWKQVAKDDWCYVALEAQRVEDNTERRSDDYLRIGVWPLWFFPKLSARRSRSVPVLDLADIARIPVLLMLLSKLPDPTGTTWDTAGFALQTVIDAARRAVPSSPEAPELQLTHSRTRAVDSAFKRGYKAGYTQGRADAQRLATEAPP